MDAKYRNRVYAGDAAAYRRYRTPALERQAAEDQLVAAHMNEDAAVNRKTWAIGE